MNENFKSRKWLMSMYVGECRVLPNSLQEYKNLKSTCHQLKQLGEGEWKVRKEIEVSKCDTILPKEMRIVDGWNFVKRIPLTGYTLVERIR